MKSLSKLTILCLLSSGQLSLAAPAEVTTYFGSAWSGIGFVLGYGAEAAYVKYACSGTDPGAGKECDGPPREGLIRKFASITDGIIKELKYTTCQEVPTSGTKDITYSSKTVTVTFGTPKQKIPTDWTRGGSAFDRRLEFSFTYASSVTIKAVVEGSCNSDQSTFMSMNMEVGSHAPGYTRPINLWVGKKDGLTVADVYTIEKNSSGYVRSAYVYNVSIDESNKNYTVAGSQTNHFDTSDTASTDVFNVKGNFSTHQASIRMKRFNVSKSSSSTGNAVDISGGLTSLSGSDDALLSSATSFDLLAATSTALGIIETKQGCMDFDADTTAPTSATACSGLDYPSSVPAPVIDSSGKFSPKWMMQTAKDKLADIPSL